MTTTLASTTNTKTLGDVARFIRGITFKPEDRIAPDTDGAVVCMRTKNVQADLDEKDLIAVPEQFVRRDEQFLQQGDILVSSANSWELVGKCSWVNQLNYRATAGGFISILRADSGKIWPRYLYHWVASPTIQHALRHCGRQTTNISNLDYSRALELPIPIPHPDAPKLSLSEQRRIADILDKADAVRRKRREAIDEFNSLRPAIFSEMFAKAIANGEWSSLDHYLVELRYGTSNKSGEGGYPALRIPNIVRGIIDLDDLKNVEVSESEFEKLRLVEGDMLFVRTNGNPDYVGRCAIFEEEQIASAGLSSDKVIYASYLIRARLETAKLRPAFLQAYLQTPAGRRNVRDKCRTSAGQYNINTKGIGGLQIPKVAIEDQKEYEARVAYLKPRRAKLIESAILADNSFHSLVQRAFRGEL